MKVAFIGAGRLAANLSRALAAAGHDIVQVYSRTAESAGFVAELSGSLPVTDTGSITMEADIYIVSVSDSAIAELLPEVCRGREDKLFVHTAGSIPMDIFKGRVHRYGVLYPMQTFSKERLVEFSGIPVFIEASDAAALETVRALASTVSGRVETLSSDDRRYIHLAAVFACNFVNHCYALSADILASRGVPFDVMLSLVDETARKVHEISPAAAQTGPAMRYDMNVIGAQAGMLGDCPMVKEIYELMSRSIHQKAKEQ